MITSTDNRRSREMSLVVRQCVGCVCYAAVSDHLGVTSSRAIDKKTYAWRGRDADKQPITSNRSAGWKRGNLPSDDSVAKVLSVGLNLEEWRDLLLWKALDPRELAQNCLLDIFNSLAENLPRSIRLATLDEKALGCSQLEPDDYLNLRLEASIKRLTVLAALARLAERQGDADSQALAALCFFDLLPAVLRSQFPLFAASGPLFTVCWKTLWSKVDLAGVVIDLSEAALLKPREQLPPGELHLGTADVYQVHQRLIRLAKLHRRPANELEKSSPEDNPFAPNDARHWIHTTQICRFAQYICQLDPCPEREPTFEGFSFIRFDADMISALASMPLH
jgi:hypothetical protein